MDRLEKTPKKQQEEEGKRICIEIIEQMQAIEGIHGVHVMAYRQEETVSEIIERAKLLPRRPIPGYAVREPQSM
jgi:methylenetetrahydrofolate reductase (NADPH)